MILTSMLIIGKIRRKKPIKNLLPLRMNSIEKIKLDHLSQSKVNRFCKSLLIKREIKRMNHKMTMMMKMMILLMSPKSLLNKKI
jgi:hypothetical protein